MGFQREMACVEETDVGVRNVALERLGAGRQEEAMPSGETAAAASRSGAEAPSLEPDPAISHIDPMNEGLSSPGASRSEESCLAP